MFQDNISFFFNLKMMGLEKENVKNGNVADLDDATETDKMLVKGNNEKLCVHDDGDNLDKEIQNDPIQLSTTSDSRKHEEKLWVRLRTDKLIRRKYILTAAYIVSFLTLVSQILPGIDLGYQCICQSLV
jgi:hypothetical protein